MFWRRSLRPAGSVEFDAQAAAWVGLPILLLGLALHSAGAYFFVDFLSEISFLLCLAGLCWCLGGWMLFQRAGPSIGFLVFMLPLPYGVEVALANPLQRVATVTSTYLLQTAGLTASADGNIIVLNHGKLEVVEACGGLGMMVTFLALATAVALVLKRPLLDRFVIVVSALPIALLANIIRITVTGILQETVGAYVARLVYHDLAGLVILMPLALFFIWVELKILTHLFVEARPESPAAINLNLGSPQPPAATNQKKKSKLGFKLWTTQHFPS
jgi:exosortase